MCSSQVKKSSLMTPEMLEAFEARKGITKLPTYTPQTGEKRLKQAQADYAKKNPIPEKKATFSDDMPKRFEKPTSAESSSMDNMRNRVANLKRLRERGF